MGIYPCPINIYANEIGFIHVLSVRFTRKTNLQKAQLHNTVAKFCLFKKDLDATAGILCEKIFVISWHQSWHKFYLLKQVPMIKIKSVIEYTSAIYHKLLEALPYKEIKRKATANLEKRKMNTNKLIGYVRSKFNLANQIKNRY